ncbi:MAG: valine--pyruvate transaminase [Verrucomicrobiales bacterium]|nr:valine--pyruvate transaminase [Verrucomicrobiales bacterium]
MSFDFSFSNFGEKIGQEGGIVKLMKDLGEALTENQKMRMMGGGNPAAIPEVQSIWREQIQSIIDAPEHLNATLGDYDGPSGNPIFLNALAESLNEKYGWHLTSKNISVTSGAQTAFFFLFNLLAGESKEGIKKILLPIAPEYIGYSNQGINNDLFISNPGLIEETGDKSFKYKVDFDNIKITKEIAAICVSRPTNPSGNVLTDQEVTKLSSIAKSHGIPFIIDNAYGNPFPGAIYTSANPIYDDHVILTLSLSKLGLPGTRTGIVIGHEKIIEKISAANAVIGLANNNIGQAMTTPLIKNRKIFKISEGTIRPYYFEKMQRAREYVRQSFAESIPYKIHDGEGAFFLWFWFPDLPITSTELYERLKKKNVLVVPGEYFFYGMNEEWEHTHQCIRITFSQPDDVIKEGIKILAEEVKKAYQL